MSFWLKEEGEEISQGHEKMTPSRKISITSMVEIGVKMRNILECLCCNRKITTKRPRQCPICDHIFQGNGWDGIDAHWRAKHEKVMPYEEFWKSLCPPHKS